MINVRTTSLTKLVRWSVFYESFWKDLYHVYFLYAAACCILSCGFLRWCGVLLLTRFYCLYQLCRWYLFCMDRCCVLGTLFGVFTESFFGLLCSSRRYFSILFVLPMYFCSQSSHVICAYIYQLILTSLTNK